MCSLRSWSLVDTKYKKNCKSESANNTANMFANKGKVFARMASFRVLMLLTGLVFLMRSI